MNPELKTIFERRSIRAYEDREIEDGVVGDLLEAAMAAPSACAKDPWHIIVVKDRDLLLRIAEGLPNGKMLGSAAVGLVVCGDIGRAHDNQVSYMLQDCSAAIENILLAATSLGLGACWLGVHPREKRIAHIRELLAIPDGIIPVSAIAVGWPADKPSARTRYDEAKVHWEHW
jgi:nitroreductase